MEYKALLQERADLVAEGRALFEAAERAGRGLNAEEAARDDAINARLTQVNADIKRHEARRERERSVAPVQDGNRQAAEQAVVSGMRDRAEDDPKRGFANLADFALAVRGASRIGGHVDERLRIGAAPTNFHQEGGNSGEGYNVPPAMRNEIWELVFETGSLLSMVNPEPTSSNSVEILTDETTPWGATGIQASWRGEGTQMTASKMATKMQAVKAHELYAFVLSTDELLADGPRLNERLTRKAPQAIAYKASEAIMTGTGVGQPLGYLGSGAMVEVAKEAGQAADTIVAANVAKTYSRALNPGRSIWLANQDILPQLMTMTLGNQPIWTPPASGFANAPGGFLFGRPVQFSEHCPTLGDAGDIQLFDPTGYYAITRGNVAFDSSIHLFFDYGIQAFRWTFRFGGQPLLTTPVSPAKGSATRSHFVKLADRA